MRPDRTAPAHCPSSEPVTEETLQVDLWFLQLLRRHAATVQRIVIDKYVILFCLRSRGPTMGRSFFCAIPHGGSTTDVALALRCRDLSIVPVVENECGSSEDECY